MGRTIVSDASGWDEDEFGTAVAPRAEELEGPEPAFALVVIEGPEVGQRFELDARQPLPALVGQSPACAIQLSDAHVSRRHAELDIVDGRLRVTDLESTNGSWIGNVAILCAAAPVGEVLRFGGTALRVEAQQPRPGALSAATSFGRMLGASREMRRLYPLLERLAASDIPVVIEGETGTGKEVLAEALHEAGARAAGPYVVFDCTAVPVNLVEAELFGHERGAFTGATTARKGLFEQAHGGTLLIDEIGDLDFALQPKLLRAIERQEIRRVGGDRTTKVDVRVLAATRRDLDRLVQEGRFRDDLFHRLAVGRVELPPLRKRRGDVLRLVRAFWQELAGDPRRLSSELMQRWEEQPWPGNVRELRNAVAREIALGDLSLEAEQAEGQPSMAGERQDFMAELLRRRMPLPLARRRVLDEFERRYVEQMLAEHGGNVSRAAAAANITRRYFQKVRARSKGE